MPIGIAAQLPDIPEVSANQDSHFNHRLVLREEEKVNAFHRFKEHFKFLAGQAVEYDDNIFTAPRNQKESDVIFIPTFGVGVVFYKKEPHALETEGNKLANNTHFGINYIGSYDTFIRHPKLNGFTHNVILDLGLNPLIFNKKLNLALQENFRPQSYITDNSSGRQRRDYRVVNDVGATLEYPFTEKTKFVLPYHNVYTKYLDKQTQRFDSWTNSFVPELHHNFTPKTAIFSNVGVTFTSYKESSSYVDVTPRVGFT
jgi:hypothetical protein